MVAQKDLLVRSLTIRHFGWSPVSLVPKRHVMEWGATGIHSTERIEGLNPSGCLSGDDAVLLKPQD